MTLLLLIPRTITNDTNLVCINMDNSIRVCIEPPVNLPIHLAMFISPSYCGWNLVPETKNYILFIICVRFKATILYVLSTFETNKNIKIWCMLHSITLCCILGPQSWPCWLLTSISHIHIIFLISIIL